MEWIFCNLYIWPVVTILNTEKSQYIAERFVVAMLSLNYFFVIIKTIVYNRIIPRSIYKRSHAFFSLIKVIQSLSFTAALIIGTLLTESMIWHPFDSYHYFSKGAKVVYFLQLVKLCWYSLMAFVYVLKFIGLFCSCKLSKIQDDLKLLKSNPVNP